MKKHRYAGCIVAIALTPSYIWGALYTCRFLYDLLDLFARSHFYPRRLLFFFAVDIAFIYHRLSFCYPFTSLLNYLPKNLYVISNIQLT